MAPTDQKALFLMSKGGEFAIQSAPVPDPKAGEVLARVDAASLNPVDWFIQAHSLDWIEFPGVLGFDGAGVVEEVGEGVTSLKKGDRMYVDSAS
jgi:NADPH:quinone reductase-like Zn-dependent oxidoreductase